jgi:hypothetical protein
MVSMTPERSPALSNPLDVLEELVDANEWPFDRLTDAEMVIEISGRWCDYRLFFAWQPELCAVYLSCRMDVRVPPAKRAGTAELLLAVNEKLWLGHFDLCSDESVPVFRHTLLLRGSKGISVEQLEDLVDIAASECERFYPAFQYLLWGGRSPKDALSAALLDTVGEA